MRYKFFENQQIGLMLNIIDREYKKDELEQKLIKQKKLAMEREIEIKKLREQEKLEHDERDRLQALKMQKRAQNIKQEMLRKAKEREEEDRKLMIKNELRKIAEEKERKERQEEIKAREEIFRKRIDYLYALRLKRRDNIEKELMKKEEIQKKNLEKIKMKKDKILKEKVRNTEEKIKRALHIIKINNSQRDLKNRQYYDQKSEIIKQQLELQKEQEKNILRERQIHSAIKREEIEFNLKRKEELLKRNRLKLIYELNEKDKKINLAKSQKTKIWEEQRKLSRNFEENRAKLLTKFKEIMGKRRKKSKEQIISELLTEKASNLKSLDFDLSNKNSYQQRNHKIYGNKNKKSVDGVFLTNLSMRQIGNYNYKVNNS